MAVSLATSSGSSLLRLDSGRVARRSSLLDISNDLIRSLPSRQHKRRLSTAWEEQSQDSERCLYQSAMTIRDAASLALEKNAAASIGFPPTAVVVRRASSLLNSDPGQAPPLSSASSSNERRNVYVCGQKMVVKQSAKPIGSIKKRSQLSLKRARLTDFAVIFAVGGLILAIIDAELLAGRVFDEGHFASLALRSIVIFMTALLLVLIVWYHVIEVKILMLDNSTRDFCVVITIPRLVQCILELCICSICPLPATFYVWYARLVNDRQTEVVSVPLGGILTMAMFLRLYLICRFTAFRSLRTLMVENPLTVLLFLWVGFASSIAWLFTQCERQGDKDESPGYLSSMWFMMSTLMANGYGDTIPETYCGRALSIITSLAGIFITAALVAVVKEKLQLSQTERRVNEFVTDSRLATEKKNAAAAVLQHTWFIHKCKTDKRPGYQRLRTHQRRFLGAINEFRRVKFEQRTLSDEASYDLSEVTHIQKGLKQIMADIQASHLHTARMTHFVSQQLEQLRGAVEHWQVVRASQQTSSAGQQLVPTNSPVSRARRPSIDSLNARSLSAPFAVLVSGETAAGKGLDATAAKDEPPVIPGEVVNIAYDNDCAINGGVDGW